MNCVFPDLVVMISVRGRTILLHSTLVYFAPCGLKNFTAPMPQPFGHTLAWPACFILAAQFMQIQCIPAAAERG